MSIPRIVQSHAVVMVVDMQEKLLGAISGADHVCERARVLIEGSRLLGLPVIVTEQYPEGLGPTVPKIREKLDERVKIERKLKFSAFIEPVRARLAEIGRRTIILCGIETHVCVLATALDLAQEGYVAVVAADATGSRHDYDKHLAIIRMQQSGITISSVESALLEMTREAGTERFKNMLNVIR